MGDNLDKDLQLKTNYSAKTALDRDKVWKKPIAMMPVGFGAATIDDDHQVHFQQMTPEELDQRLIDETLGLIKRNAQERVDKVLRFKGPVPTVEIVDTDKSPREAQLNTDVDEEKESNKNQSHYNNHTNVIMRRRYKGSNAIDHKGGYEDDTKNIMYLPIFVDSPSCEPLFYEAEYEQIDDGEIEYIKN